MDGKIRQLLERITRINRQPYIFNEVTEKELEVSGGRGHYGKFEIDLSKAHTDEEYSFYGDHFTVEDCPDAVTVKFNDRTNPSVDLEKIDEIEAPFTKFYITNVAGSGTLKLLTGSKGMFYAKKKINNLVLGADYIVYPVGSLFKCMDGVTGKIQSSNEYADVPFNYAVSQATYGNRIILKTGNYKLNDSMDCGTKAITVDAAGRGIYTKEVVKIYPRYTGALSGKFCIVAGDNTTSTYGTQIKNLVVNGNGNSVALGGIEFRNINGGMIKNVFVNDFRDTSPRACGIKLWGDSGKSPYYNMVMNCFTRRCTDGLYIGFNTNATTVIGGGFTTDTGSIETTGIHIVDADTCSFLGCINLEALNNTNSKGVHIEGPTRNCVSHKFFGTRFEGNYDDIVIDAGAGAVSTGGNQFIGCSTSSNANAVVTDAGEYDSYYHFSSGYVTEKGGAEANVADGGTIAHGLASTPTYAIPVASVAGETASLTGKDATNLTIAIKKHDGTAGTNQTIYWKAWI